MLVGKQIDKYLVELVGSFGWKEALRQFERDIKSGYIAEKDGKLVKQQRQIPEWVDEDEVDEWLEFTTKRSKVQETYFILVKDKQGVGHTIFVDEADYTRVSEYDWWIKRDEEGYYCGVTNINGNFISLQQFILGIPREGNRIVFKDKNKLNVKRSNMKIWRDKVSSLKFKQKFGYDFA